MYVSKNNMIHILNDLERHLMAGSYDDGVVKKVKSLLLEEDLYNRRPMHDCSVSGIMYSLLSRTQEGVSPMTISQLECVAIEKAMITFEGDKTKAAKSLGIGRATLYNKIKKYNIKSVDTKY